MNNLCFNDTPIEIKQIIFDYLSLNEKAFVVPYVCRKWCGATYANRKKTFDQLFYDVVNYHLPVEKEFAIKHLNLYFKILNTNHLPAQICNKDYTFKQYETTQKWARIYIIWNPKTLKIDLNKRGGWGDIRCSYSLKIATQNTINNVFEMYFRAIKTYYPEQGDFFGWKLMKASSAGLTVEEKSYFTLCEQVARFVADAFNFQIVNHVNRLAELNLIKLLDLKVAELPNQLLFACDDRGIITEKIEPSYPWEDYFSIIFKGQDNEKPFISNYDTKGLSLLKEEGPKKFTIKHLLKCCVLSKTVSLLSRRIDFLNNLETNY